VTSGGNEVNFKNYNIPIHCVERRTYDSSKWCADFDTRRRIATAPLTLMRLTCSLIAFAGSFLPGRRLIVQIPAGDLKRFKIFV
jgi:hypothetical protein